MFWPLLPQLPSPQPPPAQGLRLLLATCLGTALALLAGRALVLQLTPTLTPDTPLSSLRTWRLLSADPVLRREASLLLASREPTGSARQRQGLWGQGWGRDPLAALALKRAAQAAEAAGQPDQALTLWQSLWQRFPQNPASADALYSLGRQQPRWRQLLLQRFPAHPAALAAALELGSSPANRLQASLHLARWGPRWPGAEALLVQACRGRDGALQPPQRRQLALGLQGDPALELALGQALLKGDASQQGLADRQLLALAQRWPTTAAAREASALLSQREGADTGALLVQLPAPLQASAAVQARLTLEGQRPWRGVLKRWPRDPASWELQWQLARQALLQQRWAEAALILKALAPDQLAAPLAARPAATTAGGPACTWASPSLSLSCCAPPVGRPGPWPDPPGSPSPVVMRVWIGSGASTSPWRPGKAGASGGALSRPKPPGTCGWRAGCALGWATTGSAWVNWSRPACGFPRAAASNRRTWNGS